MFGWTVQLTALPRSCSPSAFNRTCAPERRTPDTTGNAIRCNARQAREERPVRYGGFATRANPCITSIITCDEQVSYRSPLGRIYCNRAGTCWYAVDKQLR
jgi:hypothetical protein